MKVAVAKDTQGCTGSIYEAGFIGIYEKANGVWKNTADYENPIALAKTAETVGRIADRFAGELAGLGCTVLVAKISGAVFRAMERVGMQLFSDAGRPETFLDDIERAVDRLYDERRRQSERRRVAALYTEAEPHAFQIDLERMLAVHPELNDRRLLVPFLEMVGFESLTVACVRVPDWLGGLTDALGYTLSVGPADAGFSVRVDNPRGMNENKEAFDCGGCTACD